MRIFITESHCAKIDELHALHKERGQYKQAGIFAGAYFLF